MRANTKVKKIKSFAFSKIERLRLKTNAHVLDSLDKMFGRKTVRWKYTGDWINGGFRIK